MPTQLCTARDSPAFLLRRRSRVSSILVNAGVDIAAAGLAENAAFGKDLLEQYATRRPEVYHIRLAAGAAGHGAHEG